MSQSLVKNYLHIVFSTKHREPTILPSIETELHSYLGGICKTLECYPVILGGYIDHIHILCMLSKKIPTTKLLAELKADSSKWVKTKGEKFSNFYWQDDYGAFSVNPYDIDVVKAYIEREHEHHQRKTFQDEFREFLKKDEVEYDERYVWDLFLSRPSRAIRRIGFSITLDFSYSVIDFAPSGLIRQDLFIWIRSKATISSCY